MAALHCFIASVTLALGPTTLNLCQVEEKEKERERAKTKTRLILLMENILGSPQMLGFCSSIKTFLRASQVVQDFFPSTVCIDWIYPPGCNRHHQDFFIAFLGSWIPTKPHLSAGGAVSFSLITSNL